MKKAGKKLLTIIAASTVTFFSLASCVIAVVAWFSISNQSNVNGNSMRVATAEDGCDIGEISLIKFNYHEETHGSGINEFITIDYLNPATGEVKKYGFNDEYNHFGETVDEAFIPVSTMNIYDPIDLIVTNHDLIDLNCNAVYEISLSSEAFTNCYLQLGSERLVDKEKLSDQIFLTDCADFDVYSEADLAANNPLFREDAPNDSRYHKYYPSYKDKANSLTENEDIYYKISYLSSLEVSHAHYYGTNPKPTEVSLATNKAVSFTGEGPTRYLKIYVNVNYSPAQLLKYKDQIYNGNIKAIFDYAFSFKFTESAV